MVTPTDQEMITIEKIVLLWFPRSEEGALHATLSRATGRTLRSRSVADREQAEQQECLYCGFCGKELVRQGNNGPTRFGIASLNNLSELQGVALVV